jgi:DNA-binding response OmpR family regulator
LPHVYADKDRLTQILVNLIGNAWQYTPEGGSINIYARVTGEFMQVDVEDTGIGIIEQDIQFVFDRFFRSERTEVQVVDGTGLGLSITKSFVEMLGGQIWLESELDVGSTFSFTIPLDKHHQNRKTIKQLAVFPPAQFLIVEDTPNIADWLRTEITGPDYQLVALNQVKEALEFARRASKTLKLIILDASLRAEDSFTLLEQLKTDEATRGINILIASFYIDQVKKELCLQIVDYLSSAFQDEQILASVKAALNHAKKDGAQPSSAEAKTSGHILIIEKNRKLSRRLKHILAAEGYEIQCAFNGQQALDMAMGYKPMLALINLDISVDGKSIVSHFRSITETETIPVIAITDRLYPFFSGQNDLVKMLTNDMFHEADQPVSIKKLISDISPLS